MYRDANREGWPHDGTVRTPDQVLLTDAVQTAGGLCHRGAACGHQGFQIQPPAGADTQPLGRGLAQPGAVGWSTQKLGHVAGGRGGHCRHSGCCVAVALMAAHAPSTQEPVCLLSPPVSDGPKLETFHTSVVGGRVMQWVGGAQRAVAVRRARLGCTRRRGASQHQTGRKAKSRHRAATSASERCPQETEQRVPWGRTASSGRGLLGAGLLFVVWAR